MRREEELRRRLRTLTALRRAMVAMKSVAALHFRAARRSVAEARDYREGIERMLGAADETPPMRGPAGLLVVGAELGLCGGYGAQIVEAAIARREALGDGPTLCAGRRAAAALARRGIPPDRSFPAPTSVDGITGALLPIAEEVLLRFVSDRLGSFYVVSSRFAGVGRARPECVRLLPLSAQRAEVGPGVRYVSAEAFTFAAIRERLYIALYDVLLDAIASEHGARLVATQAAETWLEDRAGAVRRRLAAARREATTQEVIEIAGGARARAGR